jgi:hypothetical protein
MVSYNELAKSVSSTSPIDNNYLQNTCIECWFCNEFKLLLKWNVPVKQSDVEWNIVINKEEVKWCCLGNIAWIY